jgi:methionine aminopeptidase
MLTAFPGISHPTTVSPSSFVTPYTPLKTDEAEAAVALKPGDVIKIQLGAQIDGFGTIVCDTIIIPSSENKDDELPDRQADLLLATYYANELLLRLMVPPGLLATGTDEEKAKAAQQKPITQSRITTLLDKVVKSYGCNLVESTTSWLFDRNEIEGKKKIVLAPGEGSKGEGVPAVGEVWGVEMGVSLGSGKIKTLENRPTLHRRTTAHVGLKRPSSRKMLSEAVKKFGLFPFSLRQLDDERDAKVGVVECVRGNAFRQYEVVGDKDSEPVARVLSTIGKYPLIVVICKQLLICTQSSPRMVFLDSLRHQSQTWKSTRPAKRLLMRRSSRSSSNLLPRIPEARARTRRKRSLLRSLRQQPLQRMMMMMKRATMNKAAYSQLEHGKQAMVSKRVSSGTSGCCY